MSFVLAIRPEPGCSATIAAGEREGLSIEGCPLFEIRPLPWDPLLRNSVDGLLLGSANAVRHGGVAVSQFRDKPVYAVGAATARAATQAGFSVAMVGEGELQALVERLDPPLRLLRLTGAEHVSLEPPAGIEVDVRVVYESVPRPLPQSLAKRLGEGALVLLHSAAAARHFAAECDRHELARDTVRLASLGPRIATAAGAGWHDVRSAPEPNEAALLALAREMCHEPGAAG